MNLKQRRNSLKKQDILREQDVYGEQEILIGAENLAEREIFNCLTEYTIWSEQEI